MDTHGDRQNGFTWPHEFHWTVRVCVCVREKEKAKPIQSWTDVIRRKMFFDLFRSFTFFFPFSKIFHISSSVYVAAEMHLKCMFTTETEGCFVKENYNICNKYIYFFICNIRPVKFPRYQINSESGDLGALSVSNIMDYCTIEYTELFSRFILLRKLTN